MSSLSNFFFGTPGSVQGVPTTTPQQQQLLQMLLSGLGGQGGALQSGLGFLGDLLGGDTSKFEQPLINQYFQSVVPQLAERFAGQDAMSSSAFKQDLSSSGQDLMTQLGALRGSLQLKGLDQLGNLFQQSQANQFTPMQIPGEQGFLNVLMGALGKGLGSGIGNLATGGLGAIPGIIGSLFAKNQASQIAPLQQKSLFQRLFGG